MTSQRIADVQAGSESLANYIPAEKDLTKYLHLRETGRRDIDGSTRSHLDEKAVDFKGAKILMVYVCDGKYAGGKYEEIKGVIVPGILIGDCRSGRTDRGLETSKIALLPESKKEAVRGLAYRTFQDAERVWIW